MSGAILKTILLVTNSLSRRNGWSTVGFYIKKQLQKLDYRILTISGDGCEGSSLVIFSSLKKFSILTQKAEAKRLKKELRGESIDTIICNIEPLLPLCAILKRKLNIKNLMFIGHGTYAYFPFISGIKSYLMCRYASAIDCIIVPSEFTKGKVQEWYSGDIYKVKWGVDLQRFKASVHTEKKNQFVFIGQLKERKGVSYLIKAFKKLLVTHKETKLVIIGDYSPSYMRIISAEDLDDKVVCTGVVDHNELVRILTSSLCHVLPSVNTDSQFEGFGLVHLEANACGIPTIGCRDTANEEVIIDGFNGFLVDQKDSGDLYTKMKMILSDKILYGQLCSNSKSHAASHSWENSIAELIKVESKISAN